MARSAGIECLRHQHVGRVEVAGVVGGIDGGAEPDEPAPRPLAQGEAQLQLGGSLVDLVHYQGVMPRDQVVLEPPARDAGGDDHHVPRGRFGRGLALPVHHPDPEWLLQDRLGDGADAEGLADAGPGNDAESAATGGPGPQLGAMLALEEGVEVQAQRQLDRFTRGARGRDHDDPSARMRGVSEGIGIRRKVMIAGGMHGGE